MTTELIEDNEVRYWSVTEGDYNDVYSKFYYKGTASQVEEAVKEYFEGFDESEIEEINSDGIGYCVYQKQPEDWNVEEDGEFESLVEYVVDAWPVEDLSDEDIEANVSLITQFL